MRRIFRILAIGCMFWVAAGCDGLTLGKPNLYVQYEENREVSEIYYLSYVREGADGHSGKNIIDKSLGTITFKGKKYHSFSIPRGLWDIYFEWYSNTGYASINFENERCTINTRLNEWARLDCRDSYGKSYWEHQGDGEMY